MFDAEFRTYGDDDPAIRGMRAQMTPGLWRLCEHLLGHWQQAGMPVRPAGRGFALDAPHGDRLTTIGWVYPPDRRHVTPRLELALDLLARREIPPEHLDALRDDVERFPTYVPRKGPGLAELPLTTALSLEDLERLVRRLVQFGLALA
ncbi:MAG: hypothetical protein FJ029_01665 [Actinobacteria bacterium]|nr:hypothetical protein [Actinomycetota bacterium]